MKKTIFYFLILLIDGYCNASEPLIFKVKEKELNVNGRNSSIYTIDGTNGITFTEGESFNVVVENHLKKPTSIHWHGILLPNSQDGVPYVTQLPIKPGEKYSYFFPIRQAGTYWMHAHYGLQEQKLLAAPLIILEKKTDPSIQDVVMFLSDFTFRDPHDIFKELRNPQLSIAPPHMHQKTDLNDVHYDAFLTNWKTLENPEIIQVHPEKSIRLRMINGSSSSNFFVYLGKLEGKAIAIDGNEILPFTGNTFELAVAQRIDLHIRLPKDGGTFPVFAQGEGTNLQTGLILTTQAFSNTRISQKASFVAGALSYAQEKKLKAKYPLQKKEVNRRLVLNLDGDMTKYIWMLNNHAWPHYHPLIVKEGERVELAFVNKTMMSHPMHLHGHFFQVTEIDGEPMQGALRDTILVLPKSTVKVQFDADNPGNWALHCHNLYHLYAGMMTTLNYENFKGPAFKIEPEI